MSRKIEHPTTLWLPKSYQELKDFPSENVVYLAPMFSSGLVVRSQPGVIIKCGGGHFHEEARASQFAAQRTNIPIPRVLYVPKSNPWFMCQEEVPGVSLNKIIDTMTEEQLEHIAVQLRSFLSQMRSIRSKTLGSVTGGPYRNSFFPHVMKPCHAFVSVGEFIDAFRSGLMLFCTGKYTEDLLSRLPRNAAITFAHGDLTPHNIIVDGSTISGLVDWATAGFYPAYWEYVRMHDPNFMTPSWSRILQSVFPGATRQTEIDAAHELLGNIWNTIL